MILQIAENQNRSKLKSQKDSIAKSATLFLGKSDIEDLYEIIDFPKLLGDVYDILMNFTI